MITPALLVSAKPILARPKDVIMSWGHGAVQRALLAELRKQQQAIDTMSLLRIICDSHTEALLDFCFGRLHTQSNT